MSGNYRAMMPNHTERRVKTKDKETNSNNLKTIEIEESTKKCIARRYASLGWKRRNNQAMVNQCQKLCLCCIQL